MWLPRLATIECLVLGIAGLISGLPGDEANLTIIVQEEVATGFVMPPRPVNAVPACIGAFAR